MPNYHRYYRKGAQYFFTVVMAERNRNILLPNIEHLKSAIRAVKVQHPFEIVAWVVLPDHMHCIWQLPDGDADFSRRWRLIKTAFSKKIPKEEYIRPSLQKRGARQIWQKRFWEHHIRDEQDWQRHMDYIHYNPVKHGHAASANEWPHSTFYYWVKQGYYDENWAAAVHVRESAGEDFGE